ncbi:3-alpha-hydroxysteroid dehydrogenase, partial [Rhizobium ruizarguesonis]
MLFGKTILVTGVASGIGARTAELAGHMGAEVIGVDVREPLGGSVAFIKGDLST